GRAATSGSTGYGLHGDEHPGDRGLSRAFAPVDSVPPFACSLSTGSALVDLQDFLKLGAGFARVSGLPMNETQGAGICGGLRQAVRSGPEFVNGVGPKAFFENCIRHVDVKHLSFVSKMRGRGFDSDPMVLDGLVDLTEADICASNSVMRIDGAGF